MKNSCKSVTSEKFDQKNVYINLGMTTRRGEILSLPSICPELTTRLSCDYIPCLIMMNICIRVTNKRAIMN